MYDNNVPDSPKGIYVIEKFNRKIRLTKMQHGYDHDLFHTQIKISRLPSLDIMSLQIVGSDLTNDGVPAMWNKMMTKIEVSIQDMPVHTAPAPLLSSWLRRYEAVMVSSQTLEVKICC
jgi:L-ascorbate metabolism protein UlaG (beta-lactamase superfamily)